MCIDGIYFFRIQVVVIFAEVFYAIECFKYFALSKKLSLYDNVKIKYVKYFLYKVQKFNIFMHLYNV